MSNGSKIGWLFFLVLIGVRACLNDRIPDDPTTVAMKQAGVYGTVVAGGCCVLGLLAACLVLAQIGLARAAAEHRRLMARLAARDAEDRERKRLWEQHARDCPHRRRAGY